jgi:hypothetical protein
VAATECNGNGYPDAFETAAGTSPDCNHNQVPDACDISAGTGFDCNSNGTPDVCECFCRDYDRDGDVDLYDFTAFQLCFDTDTNAGNLTYDCDCAFDIDTNAVGVVVGDGDVDLDDFVLFRDPLNDEGGPRTPCWDDGSDTPPPYWSYPQQEMYALGGESGTQSGSPAPSSAPEPDPWTYEEADLAFEVRPAGGGDPITAMAPNTTYELHYEADCERVNYYDLLVIAASPSQGLTAVVPPSAGDWSSADNFTFVDLEAAFGLLLPAPGYPSGLYRTHVAYDNFPVDGQSYAGSEGHLCTFTTGSTGTLILELYMDWYDPEEYLSVSMFAATEFTVVAPGAGGQ